MFKRIFYFLIAASLYCPLTFSQGWMPHKIVGMEYPRIAAFSRIEGQVKLICAIDDKGEVIKAESRGLTTSISAHSVLVKAARENIMQWKFSREKNVDSNVEGSFDIIYEFKLGKPARDSQHFRSSFVYEYPNLVIVEAETPQVM
jgi:hypothetical protein